MTGGPDAEDPKVTPFPQAKERRILEKAHILRPANDPAYEPAFRLPPVVRALCLLNIAAFAFERLFPGLMNDDVMMALAFVPARYFGGEPFGVTGITSLITHMFMHAGWLHLAINVGTLMAFGAGLERVLGGRKLLLFYFVTGLGGAFTHALIYQDMHTPMIGASGAISGLFGGVLMMMHAGGMMGQGYKRLFPFVFIWIAISAFFGFFGVPGTDNPIAWTVHVGGFITGLLLYNPLRRLKIQR